MYPPPTISISSASDLPEDDDPRDGLGHRPDVKFWKKACKACSKGKKRCASGPLAHLLLDPDADASTGELSASSVQLPNADVQSAPPDAPPHDPSNLVHEGMNPSAPNSSIPDNLLNDTQYLGIDAAASSSTSFTHTDPAGGQSHLPLSYYAGVPVLGGNLLSDYDPSQWSSVSPNGPLPQSTNDTTPVFPLLDFLRNSEDAFGLQDDDHISLLPFPDAVNNSQSYGSYSNQIVGNYHPAFEPSSSTFGLYQVDDRSSAFETDNFLPDMSHPTSMSVVEDMELQPTWGLQGEQSVPDFQIDVSV
ncbi:hypothetical protein GSI_06569 [Ganoderma sinense ZZ0214-1]|uniref:Uncharacterized protein n=1 Tax=Ganoderma sinense ZZ0214-1 TaxID=1077348 RepID=A0A2G8SDL7_9APHY|nr:hypothetical protein GSI_06569 [Ganoderma sinense ZZ0214-1]